MIGGDDTFAAGMRDSAGNQLIVGTSAGVGINTSIAGDGTPLRDELTIAVSPSLPGTNADFTLMTGTSGYTGFHMEAEPGGYFALHGLYNNAGTLDYSQLLRIKLLARVRRLLRVQRQHVLGPAHGRRPPAPGSAMART